MTTTRYLCPLDCGWHHDHKLTQPINPTAIHFYDTQPPTEALAPTTWALSQMRTQFVEGLIREHCATHELTEWVTALATARQQLADEKARQEAYEESVVGALNERNTRDCARADKAEAQVARIRAFLEDMAGWCSPHGVAADYSRRALDALDGVDPLGLAGPKREEAPEPDDGFRWHVLSKCPNETTCPIHGRNEEPADCPPACSEAHTYDDGCQLHPGLDGVIAQSTNHEHPGWAWSCAEDDGCGWLSLGHDSAAAARRSYDRHRAKECTRVMP